MQWIKTNVHLSVKLHTSFLFILGFSNDPTNLHSFCASVQSRMVALLTKLLCVNETLQISKWNNQKRLRVLTSFHLANHCSEKVVGGQRRERERNRRILRSGPSGVAHDLEESSNLLGIKENRRKQMHCETRLYCNNNLPSREQNKSPSRGKEDST